jgi:signal transduction histidine kinase
VIIYLDGGRAVATTFTSAEQPADVAALLNELSTTPALYERALYDSNITIGENVRIRGRSYRLARGALVVGNDSLGVFAAVLPSQLIIQAGATSRDTYALFISIAMAAVILIGYAISQRITRPLSRLVRISQAVAEGDLEQRAGIVSADEIGILAETFDEMTDRLSQRTRALEEAIGRMRAILSSMGDGVILEDMEGNLHPLNTAAEVLLEEMSENFALGPLRELAVEAINQSEDLQPSPWLLERRRFQVDRKVISAHSAAVRTDKGEHLGTVIVLRNVTAEAEAQQARTQALEALVQVRSEEADKTRAILASISDGVIVLDPQGKAIMANQQADAILASLASASGGDPIQRLQADLSSDGSASTLTKRMRVELNGQVIEALSSPVQIASGEVLGTAVVMRDITDAIRAAELAARISYLEDLDTQKTEFISVASHELRSPLASAKTFIQNLLDGVYGKLNDDQAHRLQVVLHRINDEILLVNSLLDLSQLKAQSQPIVRTSEDISAIIRGVVQEFKPRAEPKGITLDTGVLEAVTAPIDRGKIWRVLSNLLDNALKFTPSGGQVTLAAYSRDEFIEVQVADTGIGIPEDQLERIFDKFYQLDSSITRAYSGMGLGLAIAREIIQLHGGTIWAESKPGTGSIFHFTLPKTPV